MTFDLAAARQAVINVKERSIGPGTVVSLATLLEEALTELAAAHSQISGAESLVHSEREMTRTAIDRHQQHAEDLRRALTLTTDRLNAHGLALAHIANTAWWKPWRIRTIVRDALAWPR